MEAKAGCKEQDLSSQELAHLARLALGMAGRFGLGREDAEDLQQSVLLDYLTSRREIVHHDAWIRAVARRKALRAKYPAEPHGSHDSALEYCETDAVTRIEIARLLARLRPGDRELWWHRRVLGMHLSELETLHGTSPSTLKRRLQRIERRLRRCLSGPVPNKS